MFLVTVYYGDLVWTDTHQRDTSDGGGSISEGLGTLTSLCENHYSPGPGEIHVGQCGPVVVTRSVACSVFSLRLHCVGIVTCGPMPHMVEFCLQIDCYCVAQSLTISRVVCFSQVADDHVVTLTDGWLIVKFTVIRPYPKK